MEAPTVVEDQGSSHTSQAGVRQDSTPVEFDSPHHAECLCPLCERMGAGYFAQLRALTGDSRAARYLSRPLFDELLTECRAGGPLIPVERVSAAHELAAAAVAVAKVRRLIKVSESRRAEDLVSPALPAAAPVHSCECACDRCQAAGGGYFAQRAALCGDTSAAERLNPAVYAALTARGAR